MSHRLTLKDDSNDTLDLRIDSNGDLLVDTEDDCSFYDFGGKTEQALRDLRDFATKALGDEPKPPAEVRASEVSFNEGLLRLAAVHNKTVTFRYAKGAGAHIEQRRLVPQEVKAVGDHMTFVGYDPDRDDVRAYRVDRMKGEVSVA